MEMLNLLALNRYLTLLATNNMEKQIIENFSKEMLDKIELRRDRYVPLAWQTLDFKRLISLLYSEISGLQDAVKDGNVDLAKGEAVDVANYAMFIHNLIENGRD